MKDTNKKAINNTKKRFFSTKVKIIFGIIFVIVILGILLWFSDKNPNNTKDVNDVISENITQQWNSDAKLIDDRLSEDYPIMYVVSPSIVDDYVTVTSMCIYNNGKYITSYYVTDTLDTYLKESVKQDAFVDLLKDNYKTNVETEVANLLTDDYTPSDVRNAYIQQYSIEDFSLKTEIDLSVTDSTTIDFYGVTYDVDDDGNISAHAHKYYSESSGTTKQIIDNNGNLVLEWFFSSQKNEISES